MSSIRITDFSRVVGILLTAPLLLAGCRGSSFVEGGPEIRFLTSKPPVTEAAKTKGQPLLPLAVGTVWEMRQIGVPAKQAAAINMRVVKQDSSGSHIEIRKNGQLWRREVYQGTASGLFLTAMGEDDKPMMHLSPPVPISLYPLKEGNGHSWNGTFRYRELTYPATGYSRISAIETITAPAGKKITYRTDTVVTINLDGNIQKFPALRWFSPGTGFIRRSFLDQDRALYVDLQKFTPG